MRRQSYEINNSVQGGPGSGNAGHKGIPGHQGGSQPKGGMEEVVPKGRDGYFRQESAFPGVHVYIIKNPDGTYVAGAADNKEHPVKIGKGSFATYAAAKKAVDAFNKRAAKNAADTGAKFTMKIVKQDYPHVYKALEELRLGNDMGRYAKDAAIPAEWTSQLAALDEAFVTAYSHTGNELPKSSFPKDYINDKDRGYDYEAASYGKDSLLEILGAGDSLWQEAATNYVKSKGHTVDFSKFLDEMFNSDAMWRY